MMVPDVKQASKKMKSLPRRASELSRYNPIDVCATGLKLKQGKKTESELLNHR